MSRHSQFSQFFLGSHPSDYARLVLCPLRTNVSNAAALPVARALILCYDESKPPDFSEYLAECDARRAWISGFNGSAGMLPTIHYILPFDHVSYLCPGVAVITQTSANMFTDGRYFLQAGQQLDRHVPTLSRSWSRDKADNVNSTTATGSYRNKEIKVRTTMRSLMD